MLRPVHTARNQALAPVSRASEARPGTQERHDGTFQLSIDFAAWPWVPVFALAALARPGHRGAAARASRGSRTSRGRGRIHDVKQRSVLRSRGALLRPGGLSPFAPDPKRGGRSADRRTMSVVAFARRDGSARVRRGASHDAGRSPLGAPPWRFSAGGRASISGIASGSVQRAPRSQVVMPGGRCPGQPAHRSETSGDGR